MQICQTPAEGISMPHFQHSRRILSGRVQSYLYFTFRKPEPSFRIHFSLSCIGEGHGNPLQCSCLENPRDGGAWWAAVYGVAHRELPRVPLRGEGSGGGGGAPRDSAGAGATEEGLTSRGGPILWPLDAKSPRIRKDPDAGKD